MTTSGHITHHTASAVHGGGADIIVRSMVHIEIPTGAHGTITHIAITVSMIRGTTEDSTGSMTIMASTTHGTMTHGITEVITEAGMEITGEDSTEATGEDSTEATWVGMIHGTTITTAGITHTISTDQVISEVDILSHATTPSVQTPTGHVQLAECHQEVHQDLRSAHREEQSEVA